MLSIEAITDWSLTHPWDDPRQIEQDLLLEGRLHETAATSRADSLAFIGGTCLHKLSALAGMKIIAGSVRGKARDLYDLDYMLNCLGVSREEAMEWAHLLKPSDWKPVRRHRFVTRMARDLSRWVEMDDYLPVEQVLKDVDYQRMASVMLELLVAMQGPGKAQDDC